MILVYRNGSRNSVNFSPSIIDVMTELQKEYNHSWYQIQEELCREQYKRDAIAGILSGTRIQARNTQKFITYKEQNI